MNEELIMRLSMLEQQSENVKNQIEAIGNQITEMEMLKESIRKIKDKKESEMLSNLGKGIFIKTKISDEELFVNVGSKIIVKKSFSEAMQIIDMQVKKLDDMKTELVEEMEDINSNLGKLVEEAQKEQITS